MMQWLCRGEIHSWRFRLWCRIMARQYARNEHRLWREWGGAHVERLQAEHGQSDD